MSILMRLPEVFPECYVAIKKSIKHEKPRAQIKTWYLNPCCKYSDMSLHYIIGKEFPSSIPLRILSIFQSHVEIMRMPQPTWRYLITSMVNFQGVCWPAALAEPSPLVFRAQS